MYNYINYCNPQDVLNLLEDWIIPDWFCIQKDCTFAAQR